MNRRKFIHTAAGSIGLIIAGCAEETGPTPTPTPPLKEQAIEVPYDELNRNYEEYIGKYVHYPRVVVDIAHKDPGGTAGDGKGYVYHVYVNGVFGAGIWVDYHERFVRGDVLELWGKVTKIDNAWNQPDLVAVDMRRIERE